MEDEDYPEMGSPKMSMFSSNGSSMRSVTSKASIHSEYGHNGSNEVVASSSTGTVQNAPEYGGR